MTTPQAETPKGVQHGSSRFTKKADRNMEPSSVVPFREDSTGQPSTNLPALRRSSSSIAVGGRLDAGASSAAATSCQYSSPSASMPRLPFKSSLTYVHADAGHDAGSACVASTSQNTPAAPSTPLPGAAQKPNSKEDRSKPDIRRAYRKAQSKPAARGLSQASAKTPSFAASPTASTGLSTLHHADPLEKSPLNSPSGTAQELPGTAHRPGAETKEAAQHNGCSDVPGRPPLASSRQEHPTSAACSPPSRSQSSQASSPKSGQESIKALSNLLLDAGLKEPSASLSTTPTKLTALPRGKWPVEAKVLCIALVGVALLSITLFLLPKRARHTESHCQTTSCAYHRGLIESQLDMNVDPCYDFAAHVCGRWAPRKEFSDLSSSALKDMVMAWLSRLPDTLHKSTTHLPAVRKATAMLDSCMTEKGSQVKVVQDFMSDHHLLWADGEAPKRDPLHVLIDLAFNWKVYLWFSLKLLPTVDENKKRRILVSHSDRMLYWRDLFKQIPKKYFENVYTNILKLFTNDAKFSLPLNTTAEAFMTLQYVFTNLVRSSSWKPPVPAAFPLGNMLGHSTLLNSTYIKDVIDTTLGIEPPLSMEDMMLFSDVALRDGLLKIFGRIDDLTILRHLAWLFLLAYAPVGNPSAALLILHGSNARAKQERLPFCSRQVEASYTLLVSSAAAVALFTEEERRRIDRHLTGILEMATEKSLAASWLDNQTRKVAVEKLRNMRRVLWPAEEFLKAEVLEEAYSNFTDNASSFAHYWIETRRSARGRFGSDAGLEELGIPNSFAEPYIQYEHVLNQLSLSLGALAPPLYYKDGTKAMLYGGLGFYYAKALVEAFNIEGSQVDPQGKIVSSWLSETVKPLFMARVLDCLTSSNSSVFPEVPAIEVAFDAFKRDHEKNDTQLSEALTEEKTFFITACLSSCAKTDADNIYGGDCNKAMSNFAPFARTFNCAEGSNMNPKTKCTFFS